ncbi:MAG TPA: rhodanese-like domain-containing protein [Gaiellaceae bacterium]|nr:rhodanese-like domain-containing protein [Gaiellaceae bacterium]
MSDVAIEELAERLGDVTVLDVRAPAEYDGSGGKACDPRQGHIPGARNLDVYRLLEMSPDDVNAELGLEPGSEIIAYCHSGSRSAMAAQALRALGYDARNYVGSWHEWSRTDLAIET